MDHFDKFNDATGIIIYLNFKNNDNLVNKFYLCFSNVTKFNIESFIISSKHDYIYIKNITCLTKIPLAFIKSNNKEECSNIIKKLSDKDTLNHSKNIRGRQILEPSFVNIQNIYKIIQQLKLSPIKTDFTITQENDLTYKQEVLVKDLLNNTTIKYKNDFYKDDLENETDNEPDDDYDDDDYNSESEDDESSEDEQAESNKEMKCTNSKKIISIVLSDYDLEDELKKYIPIVLGDDDSEDELDGNNTEDTLIISDDEEEPLPPPPKRPKLYRS